MVTAVACEQELGFLMETFMLKTLIAAVGFSKMKVAIHYERQNDNLTERFQVINCAGFSDIEPRTRPFILVWF